MSSRLRSVFFGSQLTKENWHRFSTTTGSSELLRPRYTGMDLLPHITSLVWARIDKKIYKINSFFALCYADLLINLFIILACYWLQLFVIGTVLRKRSHSSAKILRWPFALLRLNAADPPLALECCWNGAGVVLEWRWSGVTTVLVSCWSGAGIVSGRCWCCAEEPLEWCWNGVGVLLELFWSCSGVVLELFWSYYEVVL